MRRPYIIIATTTIKGDKIVEKITTSPRVNRAWKHVQRLRNARVGLPKEKRNVEYALGSRQP